MLIEGSKTLAAPRAAVWQALNDPAFLQRAIPGCRQVKELPGDELEVGLTAAVGPIKASFDTRLRKRDVVALQSYVLEGRGSAGAAGSASGAVRVELSDIDGGTLLRYSAETEVTGRVAQLGSRMIDGAARRFSEEFFANVSRLLDPAAPAAATATAAPLPSRTPAPDLAQALSGLAWKVGIASAIGAFAGTLAASLVR